jgi:serine/threonine protein kinase
MASDQSQILITGSLLGNGKYEIIRLLGHGGFGITYLARFKLLDSKVAVKEFFMSGCVRLNGTTVSLQSLNPELYEKYRERFLEEAQTLAKCSHPNIPVVKDVFKENDTAYFVMDYIEGRTVDSIVGSEGKMDESTAVSIVSQLGDALEYIHEKGILHRDIKPDNIIIDHFGRAFLIDFGSAREFISGQSVQHSVILTPGYAPFEQYSEKRKRGAYTDIYSLGATLYFMLTGQKPIPAVDRYTEHLPEPITLNPSVSQNVNIAIMKAMEMETDKRFSKTGDFITALHSTTTLNNVTRVFNETQRFEKGKEEIENHEHVIPVMNEPEKPEINPTSFPDKKSRRIIFLAAVSILAVIMAIGGIHFVGGKEKNEPSGHRTQDTTAITGSGKDNAESGTHAFDYRISDDFSNRKNWPVGRRNDGASYSMQGNKYIMKPGYIINLMCFRTESKIDYNRDFTCNVKSRWRGGTYDGFGIIFLGSDYSNCYSFFISADGHYGFRSIDNEKEVDIVKYTKTDFVNRQDNNLEVSRIDDILSLYVNGHRVYQAPLKGGFGNRFGLEVGAPNGMMSPQTVEFSDFELKGYK